LDEDPEMAAHREIHEETGLEIELLGERPPVTGGGTKALLAPRFLDIHKITETHRHIGMIYWGRPVKGTLKLAEAEHHDLRWVTASELDQLTPPMSAAVKWYCLKALAEMGRI
jgi:8-oxo-dGTP pyrophosphatase MutT (NUDIX family)